jgi:hypothetical protein
VTLHIAIAILLLVGLSGCGMAQMVICNEMVEAINQKRSAQDKLEVFWWHFGILLKVIREYKALYPQGKLARAYSVTVGIFFAVGLIAFYMLLFGLRSAALPSR